MTLDLTQPGDLFELLDDGQIECKACATVVGERGDLAHPEALQALLAKHANKKTVVNGNLGSCVGFWEGSR